jgi:hypothetical protein
MERTPAHDNGPETAEAQQKRARENLSALIQRARTHGYYDDPAPGASANLAFSIKHVARVVDNFDAQTPLREVEGVINRIRVLEEELTRAIEH